MEMRVEQLSARAEVSVDTIRYYQSKGLLDPPRREGRIAWYGEEPPRPPGPDPDPPAAGVHPGHHRPAGLGRARRRRRGPARRAVRTGTDGRRRTRRPDRPGPDGPDPAPTGSDAGDRTYTLAELAEATGMPLALLKAIEAEGLLDPHAGSGGQDRYTDEDVAASRAGLLLLEWGIPLSDLLDLARRHNEATEAVARQAVEHVLPPRPGAAPTGARPDALARPRRRSWPTHRGPRRRRPPAGLRGAPPGREHPGRPPLHPDPGQGGPRPRRSRWAPTRSAGPSGPDPRPTGRRRGAGGARDARPGDRRHAAGDRTGSTSAGISLERPPGPARPTCPTGADEDRAGPLDVRRHRPPLRPGQPHDDLRPRRPVAQAVARGPSGCRPGSTVLDLACGTGDFLDHPVGPGLPGRSGMDLSWGMLAANHAGRPAGPGRRGGTAGGHRLRRRDHLRLRAPQFHRTRRGVRRVRARRASRWTDQPARGGRARRADCCWPATASGSAHVVPRHRRPAVGPRRLPLPARSRPPTCPPPRSSGPCSARPGSRRQPTAAVGRPEPAPHRHPGGRP